MKSIALLVLVLTLGLHGLFAQESTLYVGTIPLQEIDSDYLEVETVFLAPLAAEQYFSVQYGQDCLNRPVRFLTRNFLESCSGLKDESGELISAYHYAEMLTLLRRHGWDLVQVLLENSDGDSSTTSSAKFLLRRM
ncbi:MAG: hypothetical protein NWR72_01170 [Bacteroidia bacterium]|nr:hypothetical protein [Bacteroidia bacterium]